jgi:hypothetical protein
VGSCASSTIPVYCAIRMRVAWSSAKVIIPSQYRHFPRSR